MKAAPAESAAPGAVRSARFHLRRARKDQMARWLIGLGGLTVILAVVLIFFYLLMVVFPLFVPASTQLETLASRPDWAESQAVYFSVEEQKTTALRITAKGLIQFINIADGSTIEEISLPAGAPEDLVMVSESLQHTGLLTALTASGKLFLLRHSYETVYEAGLASRKIIPSITFPFGEAPLTEFAPGAVKALALSETDTELVLAAVDSSSGIELLRVVWEQKPQSGVLSPDYTRQRLNVNFQPTALAISANHSWLYLGDDQGRIHRVSLPSREVVQTLELEGGAIRTMTMLLGGISLLAGDEDGTVSQLFPVRDEQNQYSLELVRQFRNGNNAIKKILTEQRRKGFLVLDSAHDLAVYHSTSGQMLHAESLASLQIASLALSPRADGLLIEGAGGRLSMLRIDNDFPEVSFNSLWRKIWYENYSEPEYVWQSSAATYEFEPKFSLTPLVFGTLKAAFYAMLFAIPLALMGAVYTAYFMAPKLRKLVKPGIEVMAALPTVILGFLAGLWFAPFVEEHLAGIFSLLLVVPSGVLVFAWWWQQHDSVVKTLLPDGFEPLLLLPVLILLGWFSLWAAEPVAHAIFGMDLRSWLSQEAGIDYNQRNALVVGCAMGFAVIPTLFSITEDAIFGVPQSLSSGSLALGATPWQTLVWVIIPTASPGIFSALMIGLGRAVGETMIVLMATGNTPIMDWNLFEGMRTLAANIAVEMPESQVGGSHYRILFLAALVLFMFTFVVNTGAELVRHRLRQRYSSL